MMAIFNIITGICSILGLVMSYKAFREAKLTKDTVNSKLQKYRVRVSLSEKNNVLKGALMSIEKDHLMDSRLAWTIYKPAKELLYYPDDISQETQGVLLELSVIADDYHRNSQTWNGEYKQEQEYKIQRILHSVTVLLEKETFKHEQE